MADTSSKSRELEQEAEIIPAIRHDDAEWKMIQQNTFTRWVNNHLKKANSSIATLENDFSDGLKLIELAMVLSQKNLGKFNKKVMFRSQKLENVSLALNFFQDAEKIKIVNIDSSHIVDKNKKLILGLIWTLILHYSISMGLITEKREGHPEETPKQKLLSWIRSKLPGGMPLTNFTSDWNDGVALGALVNALVPSACSDWESWHPANSLKNTEQAMKSAQEKLSVEPLITSAELIHPEIDEMSVMTYLSQFPTAKPVSSPAKPLPPPIAVPSVRGEFVGLEDFPTVHTPLEFAIQISEEGYRPKVTSQDPQGIDLHHTINKKNSQLYSVKCTPTKVGDHKFQLFLVDVATAETTPVDDATVTIKVLPSPRLVPFTDRVKLGDQVKFQVKDALMGLVDIVIVDPANSEIHLPVLEEQSGFHSADYIPSIKGLHTVNAFYRKSRIEGSPFALHVHEKIPEFNIWGRGLKDDGVRVGDEVPIYLTPIGSESSTDDDVEISVTDPAGLAVPITEPSRHTPTRVFTYTPSSSGKHKVEVKSKDSALGKSPYFVDVLPETNSAVRAYGPGLRGGVANMPSVFEVLTNGHADSLSFSIEGPSKTTIQCLDKSDGVASVAYTPTEPGIYSVNVLAGGEHIQDSPFVLNVDPYDNSFQPGAVRITGLDSNTIHRTHEPVIFQIDSRRSGVPDPVELVVFNNNMESIPVKITEKTPGMYDAEFIPDQPAKYHVDASLRGVAVPGAPFSITAKEPVDISKLRMYGPGIEGPVYSQEPTHFTIDAKQAGTGVVEVSLDDRAGRAVDIDVLDNSDGSFTVKYTAPRPGAYQLNVVFAGEKIPPIQINVKPHVDTSGIHVDFLENGSVLIGHRWNISVDTGVQKQKTQGLEVVAVIKDKEYLIPMKTNETKYTGTFVATEAGEVKFKVLFDNLLVKEYVVNVAPGCDASKCKATGLGLTEGVVNAPSTFQINTQSAGVGDLAVDIAGPSDTESRIVDHEDRTCTVEFIPREPGTYTVDVMYGDKREKIPGSPFNCNVDYPIAPSTVQVCGLDQPLRNRQPFDFIIDASKTKIGPITCRVPPVYQQPLVLPTSKSKRIHKVRFTPVGDPGEEIPLEVFYCDEPVGNSPYLLKLLPEVDVHNLTLKNDLGGVLKNVRAKKNARLMLDGSNCGYVKTLQADVLGPDGCSRECTIEPHENKGLFIITFPVDMAGKYKIASSINGISSPPQFVSIVPVSEPGDAVLKKPLNLQDCHIPLNVPSSLTFELKDDPDLNLAIIPTVKDAVDIKRISQKLPSGKVLEEVILTPLATGVNSIAFFFGGIKVHQIDYNAVAQSQLDPKESVDKFERDYTVAPNSKPFQQLDFKFDIPASPSGSDKLEAFVTMPSGSRDVAQIIDNHDGSVLVKYQPKTHGQHELSIVQNGAAVNGSPLKFFVDAYGDGLATVYGPGLSNAVVGEPAHFTVCAKGSNAKELSVSIEGPAQSTIKIHDNKDGTCSVNWTPPVPGEYKVHVKLGKHEVKESPFRVLVAGSGQKRAHLSVGSTSEVALTIANSTEIKGISASIKSPSGIDEPCLCRLIDGGKLGVSFTPREAGEHLITVKRDGKLVSKAPFKVKVDKSQVGDASKVEVTGKGKAAAVCMQDNEIIVDTTKAGYGGLSVSVQGPSKAELTCKEVKAGLIKVMYKPTEPGVYAIAVKFADHHVKDSPLTVNCTGKGAGTIQSVLKKKTEQAAMCLPNQEAVLYMKLASCSPMDTTARVMDPKGKTEDVEMRDTGDNYYLIKFRPAMEGVHNLSILHRDTHVNGSPFQFTVGSFKEGGAHKVRASGLGVVRGETNNKQYFNVYTREAGAGDLSVTIEGPSKPTFEFKDHKDGNCHVEYQVAAPGEYNVSVKFNDIHIPDSPFKVFIAAATGEARKLELASFHDQIPTGKAFTFTVLTHRARGHLEAKVTTPGHLTETIDIVPIEEGESYALRFIPKESGNHYIHVTLDGAPMRDSPFRIRVGGADLSDPTAIHAEGEGLLGGETGHKCEFVIKTVNAGSGVLTCQIDGPSKVTLDAYETTQGYKVRYTPLAPGDYFAAVKYNGVHIPGSPFKIVIDGKVLGGNGYNESSEVKVDARAKTSQGNVATVPEYKGDASKVVAKGAGLNKFFPGRPSVFTIDTGLAGTNLLMVGVVTTKGPCDEVIVKHQGNGHYAVNYRIPDRVKGFVFIKYGDQEIPGSPFSITP